MIRRAYDIFFNTMHAVMHFISSNEYKQVFLGFKKSKSNYYFREIWSLSTVTYHTIDQHVETKLTKPARFTYY